MNIIVASRYSQIIYFIIWLNKIFPGCKLFKEMLEGKWWTVITDRDI